ncbi:MAG: putative selenate reductase subunit YgfK [Ruminococcus sp.]|nr:putative selenate reductase subunit YgfK [Ruminococcus sp.]
MSEKMYPYSIRDLLKRMTEEYQKDGSVFNVTSKYQADKSKTLPIFGEKLETPVGPAAGPNTQMAQNIIAAYFAGARFFELKTVQIMDGEDLAKCISRPCIKADDEGYNCEWSTELTVQGAFEEYVKAWCVLKVISKAYDLGDPDGFVFNMSVGYDLDGIKSEKIDRFIEGLKDASDAPIFTECKETLKEFFPDYADEIDAISPRVCTSVTLSTLHGCPPDEIERIATYLLTEKHLNTFVKCNPTILGYEDARAILDKAGFDYVAFDDHHFKEDLQYADAVTMFRRLIALADEKGLEFGVKLSNTFPVDVKQNELPSEEMYMSGRSLFHLTTEMARRFSQEFDGKLRISYSGGADMTNVSSLFRAGIWPITMATTLLKPGGYNRFCQIAELCYQQPYRAFTGTDTKAIAKLREEYCSLEHFTKPIKPIPSRKSDEEVPLFDCYSAPCQGGCPIRQDIPEYIRLADKGLFKEALSVITQKNPLPFITGTICSHRCMTKCTRNFYDDSVQIRRWKRYAADHGYDELMKEIKAPAAVGKKVAIIGAGAAGLSAAYFLVRAGIQADVFEKEAKSGGIVRNVIPSFRISEEDIDKDIAFIEKMGANIHLNTPAPALAELKAWGYDTVIFAVGAYKAQNTGVTGNVVNVIDFLRDIKSGRLTSAGRAVAIIGGGNTAMDAARAAKRLDGVEKVSIVYRRTKKYMPADEEELKEAIEEGVEFAELLAPVSQADGKLLCEKMKLGEPDASGRRRPEKTGETVEIDADLVVAAIGERVDTALFEQEGISADEKGRIPFATEVDGVKVYNIGDSFQGPCTVVECIADAQKAADEIIGKKHMMDIPAEAFASPEQVIPYKGVLQDYDDPQSEEDEKPFSYRCLSCNTVCENCVSVCPNRANTVIVMPDGRREILHIDRLCNECGNCKSFCPYASAPYQDKLTLFKDVEDFNDSENKGFVHLGDSKVRIRLDEVFDVDLDEKNDLSKDLELFVLTALKRQF